MTPDPLHDWYDWEFKLAEKPLLLGAIPGGTTNRHFLLEIEGRPVVLRRNHPDSKALGIDRNREEAILNTTSLAGVSPEIIFCSVSQNILITEYIEGTHWQPGALANPDRLELLFDCMNKIHALHLDLPVFDYRQHGEKYWNTLLQLEVSPSLALQERRELYLSKAENVSQGHCLCHHDPNPANVIESAGKLYFLDWEYAGAGWPAFDYAALMVEWQLDRESTYSRSDISASELSDAVFMYQYLCELWAVIRSNQGS